MKSINKLFYVISLLMILSSCTFYSLKGTIPVHIKNIYIQPIKNNSIDQEIVDLLDIQLNQLLINQNILEIVEYDEAHSKFEITILEVSDLPYTINKNKEGQFDTEVSEWKLSVKVNVIWLDFKKGETLFEGNINEWGIYGNDLDISTDGIDNDGDGLIDSEDTDEIGAPRNSARLIAVNKIAEKILTKITSTW